MRRRQERRALGKVSRAHAERTPSARESAKRRAESENESEREIEKTSPSSARVSAERHSATTSDTLRPTATDGDNRRPPATNVGDVYVSTPSPLPPPGSDNWAAIKPLVEAGLNSNQAFKVVDVWRLPTDVILAEIARQKDGKGGTGALMARLRTLADVRNAESMGHIPKTAPPELPHERAARESREALAALAEERRRTNEEWLRKNGNAAPCPADGSPRPNGRASDGNGTAGRETP